MVRARRFRRVVLDSPRNSADPAFVWQHHHTFHDAGQELARRLQKPLVQFVDAPQVWEARRWGVGRPGWGRLLEAFGERPQLLAADLVACVSEEVAEAVRALGVSAHRILVTPTGVDPDLFSPDTSGEEVRDRLGLASRFVVGWVGSFRPFHGLPMALRAIQQLQTSLSDLALLLVGDGQERIRIQQLARALGVQNVVFTGTVPYQEMARYIAAMDVALLLDEGKLDYHYSPLKLKEYLASGKAVVAARVGEVGRILSDGVDALLVEKGNQDALASAIERLYRQPGLRRKLASAARQRAVRDWTWDRQVQKVQGALDQLAASRGKD